MIDNPYLKVEDCIERLYSEYRQHKKLFIACDFDDTVFDYHKKGISYNQTWSILKRCQDLDFYITCFTGSNPDKYDFITQFFSENGIKITGINQNPVPLPFGNHGKIYYNILLDDRAGLGQSLDILDKVINKINLKKFYNESDKN